MTLLPMMGTLLPTMGSPFSALLPLFGKTRQALLALIYTHADEAHLQEGLIHLAALGSGIVQRELDLPSSSAISAMRLSRI